ncbi:hypothetical protein C8R41DRAFT_927516 [Lentinula lateritia]|uniref:Uncharacterized protein n=1 Tax=Lentinula lateritia TaxID=40482 RepID=A0ABQ8V2C3_9AGAR|nr:hypothetical protein C8R41DRAFT_927516 [Lentinula lateritia]
MASTSSQTRSSASTTLLPTSLLEAQVLLAGLQSKSTLPLFNSQHSPDYNRPSSLPAFSYPRSLVPFCFPPESLLPLSVLTDDSPSTEPPEVYEVFEEAAPFLIYIHDFWIGRANCPLSAEHVLATATFLSQGLPVFLRDNLEQQWGIPPDHRSQALDVWVSGGTWGGAEDIQEGMTVLPVAPKPKASNVIPLPPATRTPVVPPRALRRNREVESLKAWFLSSPRSAHSKDSDNKLLGGSPAIDIVPRASLSSKASSVKMGSKPKGSTPPLRSRKNAPTTSKGKSRQIVATDEDSTSTEVESENEDEDEDEDSAPPPKCLKTTSSISASMPRRSVKLSSPCLGPPYRRSVTKAAAKPAPERSPDSTFQPVLLADAQGRLQLPEQSTGAFTPFPKFAHARNSAALNRENPLLAINPEFLELGSILETQNACFTMQDLMQVNRVIRDPSLPNQACVSALARGDLEANSAPLPGYKCQAWSSRSLKCLGSLDVELAMDALNALHAASTSNLANSLHQAADLNNQLKQVGSLFDTMRELFLRSILDLQNAGEDPVVVLEALKAAKPNCQAINLNEWTILATLFHWPSPFNLSGLDFDNRTPGEWIELLRSIHSGESMARIDDKGHLVESSPPPDSATEALEGLKEVEKGSADEGSSSQVGGSIPMELDLPMIESLAEPTLSPEQGVEQAQTLDS